MAKTKPIAAPAAAPAADVVDGEFPKMIYHPNGKQQIVSNAVEQEKWAKRGYVEDPPDA